LESFVARARRHGTANRTQVKHFTDYASKQSLGEVHAEVCLHHHIRLNADSTSTAPAQLPNAERKRRITEAWQAHLEGFPSQAMRAVIVHRLIFSMSKEQHDALVAVGINPNHVLHSSLKKVMRNSPRNFIPAIPSLSLTDCIMTGRTFTCISRCVRAQ
jgi:hypothetical protein